MTPGPDAEEAGDDESYHVLASAVNHPSRVAPYRALFNQRSLQALSRTDARLDVVSPVPFAPPAGPYSEYASLPRVERGDPYPVHHPRFLYALPKRLLYHVSGDSFAKRVPRYVERTFEPPDVVHACHVYLDGYGLLPYCRRHDLPLFVVAHGALLNDYDDLSRPVRRRVRETLLASERVLCVSRALADIAEELVDPERVVLEPIGADPDRFPLSERAAIRSEFGVEDDAPLVLFCGQLVERKGVRELLGALDRVDEPFHLVVVGHGGPLQDLVTERLATLDVPTTLRMAVSTPELSRWFAAADLLVLPSHAEGRPTVVYEAMASRTAVLGTTVGGIPEQVVDGETGVLVPPGDVGALADALGTLVAHPETLDRMGGRGLERLRTEGWTWDRHAERVTEHHRTALTNR